VELTPVKRGSPKHRSIRRQSTKSSRPPGATLSSFSARRGRTKAGYGEKPGDDYIMAAEEVAKVAVLMAALPDEVNLYEATILPNSMRSFVGRG
jgi:hypothetical protein